MTEKKLECTEKKYNIADLKIVMTTYHEKTERQAASYTTEEDWKKENADGIINFEHAFYEDEKQHFMKNATYDSIEYIFTGSLFNRILLNFNGCMLHSSAVVVDGYAYLFSADSGTGKSTHAQLWLKHFGDKAFIINDDKPAIRFVDGEWYVYGTPWSGKTNQNVNTKAKLGAIVFIERAKENRIEKISIKEAIPLFFKQTIRKLQAEEKMDLVLDIMARILTENPVYKLGCNISDEAVITAYEKIRRV